MKWDTHITTICQKSKKLLGLMYRKFYTSVDPIFLCRLYLSLVRPILEFASPVWDPYTQKSIKELESVQKFALKICSHCWDINYEMLLNMFQLPSLAARREYLRINTLHKANSLSHLISWCLQLRVVSHALPPNYFSVPFARTVSYKAPRTLCICEIV